MTQHAIVRPDQNHQPVQRQPTPPLVVGGYDVSQPEQLRAFLMEQITVLLPHHALLNPNRVERYLDEAVPRGYKDAYWDLKRRGGFGGSEMGAVVDFARGKVECDPYPDGGPSNLIAHKFLFRTFQEETVDMARGHRMEPLLRAMLKREIQCETDRDAMAAFKKFVRSAEHPWRVGNTDDIILLPNGQRWIVDYKAPREHNAQAYQGEDGVPDPNPAWLPQLLHYEEIARELDIRIDGRMIVMWDPLAAKLVPFRFMRDEQMIREMTEAGDTLYHDYLMKALIPPPLTPKRIVLDGKVEQDLQLLAQQLVRAKLMAKEAKKVEAELVEDLTRKISELGAVGSDQFRIESLRIDATPNWDVEALVRLLKGLGGNPEACREAAKPSAAKSAKLIEKMVAAAQALAMDGGEPDMEKLLKFVRGVAAEKVPMNQAGDYDAEKLAQAIRDLGGDPANGLTETIKIASATGQAAADPALVAEMAAKYRAAWARGVTEITATAEEEEADMNVVQALLGQMRAEEPAVEIDLGEGGMALRPDEVIDPDAPILVDLPAAAAPAPVPNLADAARRMAALSTRGIIVRTRPAPATPEVDAGIFFEIRDPEVRDSEP